MMALDATGVGWSVPLDVVDGRVRMEGGDEHVAQSIWLILSTSPGERVTRPDFGSGLGDLVFDVNDATLAGRLATAVEEALATWEPRIDVLGVRVTASPTDPATQLDIEIDYELRATNSRFNLVYPFYVAP